MDNRADITAWPARHSILMAVSRVAGLLGLMILLLICAPLRAVRTQPFPRWIVRAWHAGSCQITGITTHLHGTPAQAGPVLYVANHVSYLDISVLGSTLDASFVAKSEVRNWPLFGYLARLQNTVFVARKSRDVKAQRSVMRDRLNDGDSLILFPEGTSSDGSRALQFKSALFEAANTEIDGTPITVQPISLAYTRFDGMPMGRMLRPFYAWYGDMELAPHLWHVLGLGTIEVDVIFHPPVKLQDFGSRKALAQHCESTVSRGLSDALGGRYACPIRLSPNVASPLPLPKLV